MEKIIKDKFSVFAFVTAGYPTRQKTIDILYTVTLTFPNIYQR